MAGVRRRLQGPLFKAEISKLTSVTPRQCGGFEVPSILCRTFGKELQIQSHTRVWTQLIQILIAQRRTMARKFRASFSKRVAILRISLMRQKKRSMTFRLP